MRNAVPRVIASLVGLAGGGCWLAGLLLVRLGRVRDDRLVEVLSWTGLGLLVVAAAAAGLATVMTAPWWLRTIVAIGAPALGWGVVETLRGEIGDPVTEGVVGVLAMGWALLAIARAGARRTAANREAGPNDAPGRRRDRGDGPGRRRR